MKKLDLFFTLFCRTSVVVSFIYLVIILYDYLFQLKSTVTLLAVVLIVYVAFVAITGAVVAVLNANTDTEI